MRTAADFMEAILKHPCFDEVAHRENGEWTDRLLQNPAELAELFEWMESLGPLRGYLEIGTWTGRLVQLVDDLFHPEVLAACDTGVARSRRLPDHLPKRTNLFYGSSQSVDYLEWRKTLGFVDVVMIDGDHTHGGVSQDYERNRTFPGKALVFHDIANTHPSCAGISRFWRELTVPRRSIVRAIPNVPSHHLGLGIIELGDTQFGSDHVTEGHNEPAPAQKSTTVAPFELKPGLPTVSVFIQSVVRPEWELTRASLEESDVGTNYRRILHPSGLSLAQFLSHLFTVMYEECDSDYVIRFEDDIIVNRHVLHNVQTWPALQDPRFGCGWLFDPAGNYTDRDVHQRLYREPGRDGWHKGVVWRSFGVLFRRVDLPMVRDYLERWMKTNRPDYFDLAFGPAYAEQDRHVCVHAPSLVDHDTSALSNFGHGFDENDTAGGTFRLDWRRE